MHPARFETGRRAQVDRCVHNVAGAAIVSDIDVHCYLRLLAAHRPVFAHEIQG
jgi:hypothetical protein